MARYRGKKALYEVMSKARFKTGYGRTLEQIHHKGSDKKELTTDRESAVEMPKAAAQWWKKPRIIQFNAGRIEFSIPYQIAIVLLLCLILLVLAAFRLGQYSYPANQTTVEPTSEMERFEQQNTTARASADIMQPSATLSNAKGLESTQSIGDHVIVLVEYETRAQLVPVQEHFAKHGINTEIVIEKGRYFLQTKDRYESTQTPGGEGYEVKKKIAEVGAKYRAPAGYETFAPNFFSDAYGKKVR